MIDLLLSLRVDFCLMIVVTYEVSSCNVEIERRLTAYESENIS